MKPLDRLSEYLGAIERRLRLIAVTRGIAVTVGCALGLTIVAVLVINQFAFFGGTIASFALLATRNFTTFLAAILMASPVAGLRPMRALRSTRTSRPMPG